MRFLFRFRFVIWLSVWTAVLPAGAQPEVSPFYQNKKAAFSFTFDDGSAGQYSIAHPILRDAGFAGSFYVVAGFTRESTTEPIHADIPEIETWARVTWEQWREMAAAGHELGSHTMTHPHLLTLGAGDLEYEIAASKALIEEKTGVVPRSFVYPFNEFDAYIKGLVDEHYPVSREREIGFGNFPGYPQTLEEMNAVADAAVAGGYWEVPMIHGLNEEWAPLDSGAFRGHVSYCRALSDQGDLWVGTFYDVHQYIKERESAVVQVVSQAADRIEFTAETGLDTSYYSFPLTFRLDIGAPGLNAAAYMGPDQIPLPVSVAGQVAQVDGPPDRGAITVLWGETASVSIARSRKAMFSAEIRRSGTGLQIAYSAPAEGDVFVSLADIRGREIPVQKASGPPGFIELGDAARIPDGLLVIRLRQGGTSWSRLLHFSL